MAVITLTINGKHVIAEKGMTVLEAAESAGIYIPTLCSHHDLEEVLKMLNVAFKIEVSTGLYNFVIPHSVVVGSSWGEMEELSG